MSLKLCDFDLQVIDGMLGNEPTIGDPIIDDIYDLKHKIQKRIKDGHEDSCRSTYGDLLTDLFKPFEDEDEAS